MGQFCSIDSQRFFGFYGFDVPPLESHRAPEVGEDMARQGRAWGEAENGEDPVDPRPAERACHGWQALVFHERAGIAKRESARFSQYTDVLSKNPLADRGAQGTPP